MKSYEEVKKEIDELKRKNEELKKQLHDEQYGSKERWKKEKDLAENYLKLGGYSGIQIPLDAEIKKSISNYLYVKVADILENDKDFGKTIAQQALRWKKYFIDTFTPIVEEIIENLDLNVSFSKE